MINQTKHHQQRWHPFQNTIPCSCLQIVPETFNFILRPKAHFMLSEAAATKPADMSTVRQGMVCISSITGTVDHLHWCKFLQMWHACSCSTLLNIHS